MKRGGRSGSTIKIEVGEDGRPLSEEDALFRKKCRLHEILMA